MDQIVPVENVKKGPCLKVVIAKKFGKLPNMILDVQDHVERRF